MHVVELTRTFRIPDGETASLGRGRPTVVSGSDDVSSRRMPLAAGLAGDYPSCTEAAESRHCTGGSCDGRRADRTGRTMGEHVGVRLFGPLSVRSGTRRLGGRDLGGAKPRGLLEILLLARGRVVSKDVLADSLWGASPPQNVSSTLEHYVCLLRHRLVDDQQLARQVIVTEPRAYRFDTEHVTVDVDRFDELLVRSEHADLASKRLILAEAVEIARGELLEDEPYAAWAQTEREFYRNRVARIHMWLATDAVPRRPPTTSRCATVRMRCVSLRSRSRHSERSWWPTWHSVTPTCRATPMPVVEVSSPSRSVSIRPRRRPTSPRRSTPARPPASWWRCSSDRSLSRCRCHETRTADERVSAAVEALRCVRPHQADGQNGPWQVSPGRVLVGGSVGSVPRLGHLEVMTGHLVAGGMGLLAH